MVTIMLCFLITLCFIVMILCIIGTIKSCQHLKRNDFVYDYRTGIIERCFPNTKLSSKLLSKCTYEDMLYSSKPLDDKYWFTKEEISEINKDHKKEFIDRTIEQIQHKK